MGVRSKYYTILLFFVFCLTACTGEEGGAPIVSEQPLAVSFDSYLTKQQETRAVYPAGSEKVGELDNTRLKLAEFGVFATHTGNTTYAFDGATTGLEPFNFMWNQEVEWGSDHWAYEPIKYWPNDNQPADDQTPPAQGSQEHSYLSFFAYAPYSDGTDKTTEDEDDDGTPDAEGIVGMSDNGNDSGDSYITYRNTTWKAWESVDLLWSRQTDRYKMDGAGYVDGQVQFNFIHALSKIGINVRTLVDHVDTDDTDPTYPDEPDSNTKIFIESVQITSPTIYGEANMYLAPNPVSATKPKWGDFANATPPTISGDAIHDDLLWGGTPDDHEDVSLTVADFNGMPSGVTSTLHQLFSNASSPYFMFIPTTTSQPLTIRVVYYVVTYDPNLKLNNPRYYSIVRNDISRTAGSITFESNKVYSLELYLGLTTVKFNVVGVEDWATPITLDGVVRDPETETHELNVK